MKYVYTLFRTNKPPHPQCRRIILENEGALYRVEVEMSVTSRPTSTAADIDVHHVGPRLVAVSRSDIANVHDLVIMSVNNLRVKSGYVQTNFVSMLNL